MLAQVEVNDVWFDLWKYPERTAGPLTVSLTQLPVRAPAGLLALLSVLQKSLAGIKESNTCHSATATLLTHLLFVRLKTDPISQVTPGCGSPRYRDAAEC